MAHAGDQGSCQGLWERDEPVVGVQSPARVRAVEMETTSGTKSETRVEELKVFQYLCRSQNEIQRTCITLVVIVTLIVIVIVITVTLVVVIVINIQP